MKKFTLFAVLVLAAVLVFSLTPAQAQAPDEAEDLLDAGI